MIEFIPVSKRQPAQHRTLLTHVSEQYAYMCDLKRTLDATVRYDQRWFYVN